MTHLVARNDVPTVRYSSVGSGISAWFGLRYAEVPYRFGRAQRAEGQLKVERLNEVPVFPQNPSRLSSFMGEGRANPQSEHAHFLNIWAPDNADKLPVLFFIHGGAWMTGGGSQDWYNGARLADLDMIVVTVNYRLGPLGHLGDQSTLELPLPLEDLLIALEWVHEEIAAYGGDPDRITIVGQSAGGWYGHVLSMLEATRGMLHQVAHFSMATRIPWSQEHQQRMHQLSMKHVEPDSIEEISTRRLLSAGGKGLRELAADQSVRLGYAESGYLPVQTRSMPNGFLDPQQAALNTHVSAVYLQWTQDETAAFFWDSPDHLHASQEQVNAELQHWDIKDLPGELLRNDVFDGPSSGLTPYQQLVAASSWSQFQRFPTEFAQQLQVSQIPFQVHRFTHESPLPKLRSAHCFDLPFLFGNWEAWQDAPMLRDMAREEFDMVSAKVMHGLADFIHQQHPS